MDSKSASLEEARSGLSQQLDDLANEASLLNSDSPNEMSPVQFTIGNSESSQYSPIPDDQLSIELDQSLPYNDPSQYATPYIVQCVKKWFTGKPSSQEQEPLLPTHGTGEVQPTASMSGSTQLPPSYITAFLEFVWKYIFTESMREYLEIHRVYIYLMVIAVFMIIAVILFYTDHLALLIVYLRMMICYLFTLGVGDSPTPGFCST